MAQCWLGKEKEACDAGLPCSGVSPLNAEVALMFLIWASVCSYFLTFLQKGADWGRARKCFLSHPYLVLSDKSSGQQRASWDQKQTLLGGPSASLSFLACCESIFLGHRAKCVSKKQGSGLSWKDSQAVGGRLFNISCGVPEDLCGGLSLPGLSSAPDVFC